MRRSIFIVGIIACLTAPLSAGAEDYSALLGTLGGSSSSGSSSYGSNSYSSSSPIPTMPKVDPNNPMQSCLDACANQKCWADCIDGGSGMSAVAAAAAKLNASTSEVQSLVTDIQAGNYKVQNDPFRIQFVKKQAEEDKAAYDKAVEVATQALDDKFAQLAQAAEQKKKDDDDAFFSQILTVLMQK